ncbi:MAG: hypothetical protein A3I24_00265 [Candidatus Harrisonbacteria bacterium RIFCSPLOWO2_02_FULL_41_13b]|uniref:Penicillin-binding protein transpeptidase domain-containing protein n=1 Tax=Candidatus Harrisonbacteria bacterium RIFCSPLOWO2_02_FULL_41_13b TaxID=1798409 RepID=A0A1G1ZTQ8_9BACT|nr:MAG: hypothetical protein A3J53_01745 [Candidatus Harrisonbacteria bacterium RIFCSPHIGHO2_02_FULL_40_20]OGY67516.1 MAG: hypothetical protein A3I24_00265 [Candidatus Harrisonbacteria bacterium RIFCSPLOWO2_02_FULL_41_13b]
MTFRLATIVSGVIFIYSALIFKIYYLQIERGQDYIAKAESQVGSAGLLRARRGNIYFTDKNHNLIPAAINKDYPVVYAVPKEIEDREGAAGVLSQILGLEKDKLILKLSKLNDLYELLLAKASPEQVWAIQEAKIAGVYINDKNFRFYPFESLAAHILGFLSPSDEDDQIIGRYGLEAYYEDSLSGRAGHLDGAKVIEPQHGKDLILTIDRNIQARGEEILGDLIDQYNAVGGALIVADPKTGKILAMASAPNFDPNNYSEYSVENFLNPTVESVYEPGSIFKVITMSAGIDAGKITPETTYYDSGSVTLNGRTIKNWDNKAHGTQTMTQVIEQSLNTGAVFAQRQTGRGDFYKYVEQFGFKDLTLVGLPDEVSGNLINLEKNIRDINFATASFGQGISVTPIELISAIGAIANDGVLMRPFLIEGTAPQVLRRVISQETADQVTAMMVSAVKNAQIAQIPNYKIAGKTGTAQVPDFVRGGYTHQVINTYVGFAPATDPKFIILVRLDKPEGAPLAGLTVVPAFRDLAHFILNYYNIPPDDLAISD